MHTWELVAATCTARGGRFDLPKQLLDARFAAFNYRHADPEKPKFRFPKGTFELAYLTSKEYSAIVLQVISLLCCLCYFLAHNFTACKDDCLHWSGQHFS